MNGSPENRDPKKIYYIFDPTRQLLQLHQAEPLTRPNMKLEDGDIAVLTKTWC